MKVSDTNTYFSRSDARLNRLQHFHCHRRRSIFDLCPQRRFEDETKCSASNQIATDQIISGDHILTIDVQEDLNSDR